MEMFIMAYSYLTSPYTHENKAIMDLRVKCTTHAAGKLMQTNKEGVFSPITYIHDINTMGYLKKWTYADSLKFNKEILSGASRLYVLTLQDWGLNDGVEQEIEFARMKKPHKIPVYFLEPEIWVPEWPLKYLTDMEKKYE